MRSDPWLSRPMRHALGLDLPERRMSLSAHDFAQALGAHEVILAYPTKLAGTPTVTSRFVQRLAAVAGDEHWNRARARGTTYLAWARALDRPAEVKRIEKPAPKPPRAARPSALSVTDIENWLRDPYTIYAKHILKLRELDPIDLPPGAADRGIVIHGALSDFTKAFAAALPADPAAALIDIGAKHFETLEDYPEARAFWWPRFRRIARWFAGWEALRRGSVAALAAEVSGKIDIPLGERVFTLRARADRIERLAGGGYAILDYKTGPVPSAKQVRIAVSPQPACPPSHARRPRSCAAADFAIFPPARPSPSWSTSRSRAAIPRATACRSTSRTATPTSMPTGRSPSSNSSRPASKTSSSPIFPWCCRCGRAATAPTITWRG